MAEKTEQPPPEQPIPLKDPVVAGILAWLLPGLGHFYQGRWAKGALYLVCILGLFLWGLRLSSTPATGPGRAVYFSFRSSEWRLYYLGQVGIGLPALPALLQAFLVSRRSSRCAAASWPRPASRLSRPTPCSFAPPPKPPWPT